MADLHNAIKFEPAPYRAMTQLEGSQRTVQLLAGIRHEARVRANPNLQAKRLVKAWNALETQREQLKGWEHKEAREQMAGRVRELALTLKRSPKLEAIVRHRAGFTTGAGDAGTGSQAVAQFEYARSRHIAGAVAAREI